MKWNLTDLLRNPGREFQTINRTIIREVKAFESLQSRLISSRPRPAFLEALQRAERIARLIHKLEAFSYLWFSEDTGNQRALVFKAKVEQFGAEIANRMLFFDLWWQSVEDLKARQLLNAAGLHRYRLETIRLFRPHTRSEAEEKILTIKNITGSSAIITIFDVLTSGFTFELLKRKGKTKASMTREELTGYMRHVDPSLRVRAYTELFRVFSGQSVVIGELYKTRVMDWKNEQLSLRRHRSPISVRNMSNDIPDDVVNVLLKVCRKNAHIFQRYFVLKARLCGMKKMDRFHIYAPFRKTATRYRYQDAVHMVLAAYRSFSPDLADRAEQVFLENHIDAETRQGKMAGAYCYSVLPDITPYVMLNFRGDPRDVATVAHELGHAVHGMMAADQSVLSFHSTLPLAETASVFGERLLADFLLANERSATVRQQLLISQLDDLYATVLRQAFFTQFEMQAHRMIGEGATTADLCGVYLADLRDQFGKQVGVPDDFQWEWLTIPHFYHMPFYCYAYSFGTLLALALHRRYIQEGQAFVPRYLGLLATGGSESPETILTAMGINMRSVTFWQSGFDTIADMVGTLEDTIS
tara:strand:+ start:1433 stop:3187 length:1755 start_codon:yes stop_codon:yes gene_type:complete